VRIFDGAGGSLKPLNTIAYLFGNSIRGGVVLSGEELRRLLETEVLEKRLEGLREGYVILRYRGYPVGVGRYWRGRITAKLPERIKDFL
jgi:hypothetical protein